MNFNPFHIDTEALDQETVRLKRISRGVIIATLIAQGLFSLGAGEMFFIAFLVLASPFSVSFNTVTDGVHGTGGKTGIGSLCGQRHRFSGIDFK
jgi:acyl dehydratase